MKRILVLLTVALVMAAMMVAMAMPAFADQPTFICTKTGAPTLQVIPKLKQGYVKQGYECVKGEQRR
jgi:hypothetical protein